MKDEFNSLIDNKTREYCDVRERKSSGPSGASKFLKISKGNIERCQARLVGKGLTQQKRIDYDETFSPVVRYSSIRLLLGLAVKYDLDIYQMDVVTAFLQSELHEEKIIYMINCELWQLLKT